MAGGGTLSNPCNGTVARWTPKGSGARLGPIGSRGLSLDHAQRILVRVRDLRQQAEDRDRDSVRSAGSQAALCSSRVISRSLRQVGWSVDHDIATRDPRRPLRSLTIKSLFPNPPSPAKK